MSITGWPAACGNSALVKRVLRKLMRWYVEPLAADQRVHNSAVLRLVDALSERADAAAASNERARRLLGELEERLTRVERRGGGAASAPPATRGGSSAAWSRSSATIA